MGRSLERGGLHATREVNAWSDSANCPRASSAARACGSPSKPRRRKFRGNSPVAVCRRFQRHLLHLVADFHFDRSDMAGHAPAVETGAAHASHPAQRVHGFAFRRGLLSFFKHASPPLTTPGGLMIPEMLQGSFQKIVLHRERACLTFRLAEPARVVHRGQTRTAPSSSGKRQIPPGAPPGLASPPIRQMGLTLVPARDLTGRGAGVARSHRRDLQNATVNSSGQIHASLHSMYLFP
jgi:hypothetical protein